jgi:hypothetical protein
MLELHSNVHWEAELKRPGSLETGRDHPITPLILKDANQHDVSYETTVREDVRCEYVLGGY